MSATITDDELAAIVAALRVMPADAEEPANAWIAAARREAIGLE